MTLGADGRLPAAFLAPGTSSFVDFLASVAPAAALGGFAGGSEPSQLSAQATTIVALTFADGVLMAGDRRATVGHLIASRDIEKVFPADEFSAIGIAGSAGPAIELVRLFQLELEHFEKIEGGPLSLDGKANRLATMLRSQLELAMRGLAVLPLFAGYDLDRGSGRVFSYDVTGGRYEVDEPYCVGSGAYFARGSLKNTWRPDLTLPEAIRASVLALIDAAEEDSATAGPDLERAIWPVVSTVTADGYRRVPDEELEDLVAGLTEQRRATHREYREVRRAGAMSKVERDEGGRQS